MFKPPSIMKRLLTGIAIAMLASSLLAQEPSEETLATLRAEAVKLINRDRTLYGLKPVEFDARVSLMADDYCRLQIRNGTVGHFSTDGLPPYMRYSFAGGNDGLSENTASWSAGYKFSDRALYEMVRRSHDAMMGEQPPHDGHRQTILDPFATHVGIGLAWDRGEFRMAHHFIRRYVNWSRTLPRAASIGERVMGKAAPLPGYRVTAVSVHYEPAPQPVAASVVNKIDSYRLPLNRRDLRPRFRDQTVIASDGSVRTTRTRYEDGSRGEFNVAVDGSFSFDVPFKDGPGVYTIVVWVTANGVLMPISASNVSIVVTGAPSTGAASSTLVR
jgi:uncharacterized protein YkwD